MYAAIAGFGPGTQARLGRLGGTGQCDAGVALGVPGSPYATSISPGGGHVAVGTKAGDGSGWVRIWRLTAEGFEEPAPETACSWRVGRVTALAFAEETAVLAGDSSGNVHVLRLGTKMAASRPWPIHEAAVTGLGIVGNLIASTSVAGDLVLWDIGGAGPRQQIVVPPSAGGLPSVFAQLIDGDLEGRSLNWLNRKGVLERVELASGRRIALDGRRYRTSTAFLDLILALDADRSVLVALRESGQMLAEVPVEIQRDASYSLFAVGPGRFVLAGDSRGAQVWSLGPAGLVAEPNRLENLRSAATLPNHVARRIEWEKKRRDVLQRLEGAVRSGRLEELVRLEGEASAFGLRYEFLRAKAQVLGMRGERDLVEELAVAFEAEKCVGAAPERRTANDWLLADLFERLGEWELATGRYRSLQAATPGDARSNDGVVRCQGRKSLRALSKELGGSQRLVVFGSSRSDVSGAALAKMASDEARKAALLGEKVPVAIVIATRQLANPQKTPTEDLVELLTVNREVWRQQEVVLVEDMDRTPSTNRRHLNAGVAEADVCGVKVLRLVEAESGMLTWRCAVPVEALGPDGSRERLLGHEFLRDVEREVWEKGDKGRVVHWLNL